MNPRGQGLLYKIRPLNYFFSSDELHIILNRRKLESIWVFAIIEQIPKKILYKKARRS